MININIPKKSFFGAAIGTMVEYYDLTLFLTFLPILSPLFFPADSLYQSFVKGYSLLLIPMLARPLGGLLFGYLGDILGRRRALLASMYGIAIATIIIGITPSCATLGILATFIIVIAKTIQVFCFGGEYNGAGIYVVEHAQNKQEALVGSLLTATTLFGSLIASIIGVFITYEFMPQWSWRIAFMLGGLAGIIGIIYRKNLLESPHFQHADLKYHGLIKMIKQYPRELLTGIFIGGFITVPFTTVLTFINPVLLSKGYFTQHQLMVSQMLLMLLATITLILTGFIADKKTPEKIMKWGSLALIIFSYPLLLLIDTEKFLGVALGSATFIIINEIFLAPSNAYLKNLFAMQYRYRASSFSFCIGMSVLGGLTPIVENYLYQYTNYFTAASLWLIFIGSGTFLSLYFVQKKQASYHSEEIYKTINFS